jgi:hypothetical protein
MAANEHKNLLDPNRHYPLGYEFAQNNMVPSKKSGITYDDKTGNYEWVYPLQTFVLRLDGAIATNNGIDYIRMPYNFRLHEVRASVQTGGALVTVDIQESGVSILSTLLTIDAGEKTSTTAATPVVISDYELDNDNEVVVNLTIGEGEAPRDLKIYLIGYRRVS